MKYMKYMFAIALSIMLIACDNVLNDDTDGAGQGQDTLEQDMGSPVLFQYDFSNFVDGFQHNGWFIDTAGNVRAYNYNGNMNRSWYHADNGYISLDNLISNFNGQNNVIAVIPRDELSRMRAMIQDLEPIMNEETNMAENGNFAYMYAYKWNSATQSYQQIPLAQAGDVHNSNLSSGSSELTDWMVGIGEEYDPFYWE